MKVSVTKLSAKDQSRYTDVLDKAVSGMKSGADAKSFLGDLLTLSERIMLGRRLRIAQMLLAEHSYSEVMAELRVGKDTVSRVHRWLVDQHAGYEKVRKGLEREAGTRKSGSYRRDAILRQLKKKYPLYYVLFSGKK